MSLEYVEIRRLLTCKTGLRIGGSKDDIEIAGIDNPVLRDPLSSLPYIPGSSLKGKIRSLLEYKHDRVGWRWIEERKRVEGREVKERKLIHDVECGEPCGCGQGLDDCPVCVLFGPHKNTTHDLGPSRLIVRDAFLTSESEQDLKEKLETGALYTELKQEVSIDRKTGIASRAGPRTMERIPAGTQFVLNIVIRIFDGDPKDKFIALVQEGLNLLHQDYLGGSGTRGYGWIQIEEID